MKLFAEIHILYGPTFNIEKTFQVKFVKIVTSNGPFSKKDTLLVLSSIPVLYGSAHSGWYQ